MAQKRTGVYVWVTWLPRLIIGEQSCEWGFWYKANYEYYERVASDFDSVRWRTDHTRMLRELRREREAAGEQVFVEGQNMFKYETPEGIVIAGTPDMVALAEGKRGTIYDAKTGRQSDSHQVQVMIYMYLIPLTKPEWANIVFDGAVVYKDTRIAIPSNAIDDAFKDNLDYFVKILASSEPAHKVPSELGCRFCDIHKQECPERIEPPTGYPQTDS